MHEHVLEAKRSHRSPKSSQVSTVDTFIVFIGFVQDDIKISSNCPWPLELITDGFKLLEEECFLTVLVWAVDRCEPPPAFIIAVRSGRTDSYRDGVAADQDARQRHTRMTAGDQDPECWQQVNMQTPGSLYRAWRIREKCQLH